MATAFEFVPPRDALNTTTHYNYYQHFFSRIPRERAQPEETVVDFEPVWSIPPPNFWNKMKNRLGEMIISGQDMVESGHYHTKPLIQRNGLVFLGLAIMIIAILIWIASLILKLRVAH